jgi:hypothetical protein
MMDSEIKKVLPVRKKVRPPMRGVNCRHVVEEKGSSEADP